MLVSELYTVKRAFGFGIFKQLDPGQGRASALITYHSRLPVTRGSHRDLCPKHSAYLDCGEAVAALTAARDDMPGSCVNDADAAVEAELGREIGSRVGGGRIWGPSSIAGRGRGQVLFEGCVKAGVACGRGAPRSS